eukprot:3339657-Rhodomonas_salina.2
MVCSYARATRGPVLRSGMLLRACYAMAGTEIGYGVTRSWSSYAPRGASRYEAKTLDPWILIFLYCPSCGERNAEDNVVVVCREKGGRVRA